MSKCAALQTPAWQILAGGQQRCCDLLLTWMMLVVTVDTAWAVAWAEAVGDRLVTAAVAELTACKQGSAGRQGTRTA